jgi:putative flippase GtrA
MPNFILFSAIGAVGTAVHYSLLIILVDLFASPAVLASAAGFVAGALVNYRLNHRVTFNSGLRHRHALPKFFSIALAGLALNILIVTLAVPRVHYLTGQFMATGLVLLWNYLGNRFWTYKERDCAGA